MGSALANPTRTERQRVVYGSDDRLEYYQASDVLRTIARQSTVAIVASELIHEQGSEVAVLGEPSLAELFATCPDERFAAQPSVAFCSGTLIGPDLVLTAGHCFVDFEECRRARFVFGYYYDYPGQLATIAAEDIHECSELVVHHTESSGRDGADYAVVRLDRSAHERRTPVSVAFTRLAEDERVAIVGYGAGLPVKIQTGVPVLPAAQRSASAFFVGADNFEAGSGSGVFTDAHEQVGLLVAGEPDWAVAPDGCVRSRVLREDCGDCQFGGERVTYLEAALTELCEREPEQHVCGSMEAEQVSRRSHSGAIGCDYGRSTGAAGWSTFAAMSCLVCAWRRRNARAAAEALVRRTRATL